MKEICLESAKRKYTKQQHEGVYHSLWARTNWKAKWTRYQAKDGKKEFAFKELPNHRRKLAILMANKDNHKINDVSEGEQKLVSNAPEKKAKTTIIRRPKS